MSNVIPIPTDPAWDPPTAWLDTVRGPDLTEDPPADTIELRPPGPPTGFWAPHNHRHVWAETRRWRAVDLMRSAYQHSRELARSRERGLHDTLCAAVLAAVATVVGGSAGTLLWWYWPAITGAN